MPRKLDIAKVCQKCRTSRETTRSRWIYTKKYVGPCDDSFCYASCDLEACKAVSLTICDECAKKIEKKK